MDKLQIMLDQAKKGALGTPDKPDRSNSLHYRFWEGYNGFRKLSEFPKNSVGWLCVKAGIQAKKDGVFDA